MAAIVVTTAVAGAPASSSAGTVTASMATFGAIAVDPASGRVFVAGDDKVLAFDPSGQPIGSVADVPGARGMAFIGGSLWVAETSAGAFAKIDPVSLVKLSEHPTGGAVGPSVAAVGSKLFFIAGSSSSIAPLSVMETSTGAVSSKGDVQGELASIPGSTDRILVTYVRTALYDVSTTPATKVAETPDEYSGGSVAASDRGTFARRIPGYRFGEFSLAAEGAALMPTGVVRSTQPHPRAVSFSPAGGGVFAGTSSASRLLTAWRAGIPTATHDITLPGDPVDGGLALDPTSLRAHVVTAGSSGQIRLNSYTLAPTLTAVSPSSVVRGRTSRIALTGTGLGSVTSATLGGASIDVATDGPDRLEVEGAISAPPGAATLHLAGPFGNLDVPVSVVANGSGTVRGTVRDGNRRTAGASVQIVGETGPTRTTISATDGTFSITGVPEGEHYDITVTKGTQRARWPDRDLFGPSPWTVDVDLGAPPATDLVARRRDLPPGDVRRLVVDPATGRTFVAVGDEVIAFDRSGRALARIHEQWSASDMQIVGSKLYVLLRDGGAITEIDIPKLNVVRSVPVRRMPNDSLVITGPRARISLSGDGPDTFSSVDLQSGAVADEPASFELHPRLFPIDGLPSQFLALNGGIPPFVRRYEASGPSLAMRGTSPSDLVEPNTRDIVASGAAGLGWGSDGSEFDLGTMEPTGTTYPADPATHLAVARSAGRGGVLAFGRTVVRQGDPAPTHQLSALPVDRSVGVDAAGDRVSTATWEGELVLSDLAPVVNTLDPAVVPDAPAAVRLSGHGLGAVTAVRVDGATVPFTSVDTTKVDITLPALDDGDHQMVLETPWGTTAPRRITVGLEQLPFPSWRDLVVRQYQDLTATTPSSTTVDGWVAALQDRSKSKGDLVESLRRSGENTSNVDPVVRLYRAFLGRTPDASGLRFWIGRKRARTWTVTRMADSFADSSEFERKYGTLTNRQFVARIYTDVLGRGADAAGVDFWTRRLETKAKTRGQVMVGFSESSEYRRKQLENTDAVAVFVFLLGRAPTSGEVSDWVTAQKAGTSVASLATDVLGSEEYRTRIGS